MADGSYVDDEDVATFGMPEGKSEDDFLSEMRQRAQWCFDADSESYDWAMRDVEFCDIPGHQWDEFTRGLRQDRPCYEFNKVRKNIQQITNEQRQNRPRIKMRAVRDATEDDAEIRMGLVRNIEAISNAEHAYDTGFESAVKCGFGAWRVKSQYCDDDAFDQELRIETLEDPFSLHFDPCAKKFDRRDAAYAFVFQMYPRSGFAQRWPDAEMVSFGAGVVQSGYDWNDWWGEQEVRVAEYWYKEPIELKLYLMSDGSTFNAEDVEQYLDRLKKLGITVETTRTVKTYDVYSCICSGSELLEKPTKWPGRQIPLVPVWGNLTRVRNRDYWCGEVRFQRDPQKLYNFERSTFVEVIAKQPKQPLFATAEAVEGYENDYAEMGTSDRPVMFYNFQPSQPDGGRPKRTEPPVFPVALAQAAQMSNDDLKATSGVFDASLGNQGNETSGVAINARKVQGNVSNFQYIDNLSKALRYTGEILNELIPVYYDTQREVRIIGQDGVDKIIQINHAVQDPMTGQWITLNDISQGKYDIVVDVGPSFTTQRMEAAEAMSQMAQVPGPFQPLVQYGYLKSLDVPNIDDIQDAARMMLVKQGVLPPKEGDPQPAPPQPPPVSPEVMASAQLKGAQAEKAHAEAIGTQVDTQQKIAMAPLVAQHTVAITAKEFARKESKTPPLPADPSIAQPMAPVPHFANPSMPMTPPGQL